MYKYQLYHRYMEILKGYAPLVSTIRSNLLMAR